MEGKKMLNGKRLAITTILGIIAGFLSLWWMRSAVGGMLPISEEAMIVLAQTILGFAIGLSAWRINWAAHGILMGIFFSLPVGFALAWQGGGAHAFWGWLLGSLVVGFLIELITTPIFHARRLIVPSQTPQPHAGV
jgi:hypothetical protein